MPVTFSPAPHGANPVRLRGEPVSTATELLKGSCRREFGQFKELFQSSFTEFDKGSPILPSENGFVSGAIQAYNQHHHLVIRPDDVWIAILSQLSIYVNKHAEELRTLFIAHEGKKELTVCFNSGSRYTVDFGFFAQTMTNLLEKNVVDPDLRNWIISDFTTTTDNDRTVSSVIMMATLQKYFSYRCCIKCGIPSVTLQGEKEDWEKILARLEKLPSFGEETKQWYHLLKPVISRFVAAFDDPTSSDNLDFWQKIAHHSGGGSGPSYYSGWITAFCFWSEEGDSLYAPRGQEPRGRVVRGVFRNEPPRFSLDGVLYHRIESKQVPPGYASVPVKLDDNGVKFDTTMIAGLVGMQLSRSGNEHLDTLQPAAGWWIFDSTAEEKEERRSELRTGRYKAIAR